MIALSWQNRLQIEAANLVGSALDLKFYRRQIKSNLILGSLKSNQISSKLDRHKIKSNQITYFFHLLKSNQIKVIYYSLRETQISSIQQVKNTRRIRITLRAQVDILRSCTNCTKIMKVDKKQNHFKSVPIFQSNHQIKSAINILTVKSNALLVGQIVEDLCLTVFEVGCNFATLTTIGASMFPNRFYSNVKNCHLYSRCIFIFSNFFKCHLYLGCMFI